MSVDPIEWNYYDNEHPDKVIGGLKSFINYRQNIEPGELEYWYVGKTDDPEKRWAEHQADCAKRGDALWTRMYVIYGHRQLGFVTDIENKLITYLNGRATRRGEQGRLLNSAGERYGGPQTYSVYVLIDDKPNSASGAKEREQGQEAARQKYAHKETTIRSAREVREENVLTPFARPSRSTTTATCAPRSAFTSASPTSRGAGTPSISATCATTMAADTGRRCGWSTRRRP